MISALSTLLETGLDRVTRFAQPNGIGVQLSAATLMHSTISASCGLVRRRGSQPE